MKKLFLSLVFAMVSCFCTIAENRSLFVLNRVTHSYEYVDNNEWIGSHLNPIDDVQVGSLAYYGVKNGYTSDELYIYMPNNSKCVFVLKAFSSQIYYIIVYEDIKQINLEDVQRNFVGFNYNKEFVDYGGRKNALKGKIRQSFMEEILGKTAENNKLIDKFNGYVYTFKDGWLSSYTSLNGLSEDANKYLNTDIGKKIKYNAERKHFSKDSINKEINFQFECMFALPEKGIDLVKNEITNYNAALIYFSLFYKTYKVTLNDFKFYGENYSIYKENEKQLIINWNNFLYFTFENNILVDTGIISKLTDN